MSSKHGQVALLFEYDPSSQRWSWSHGLRDLYGLGPDEVPTTQLILDRMVEPDRQYVGGQLEGHLVTSGSFSCAFQMCDGRGGVRWLRYVGQWEEQGGEVGRVHGFVVDVTDAWHVYAAKSVEGALEHRAVNEQAKGALMFSFGVDDRTAFQLLHGFSNRAHVKSAVVARRIVSGLSDPKFFRDEPVRSLLAIVLALE